MTHPSQHEHGIHPLMRFMPFEEFLEQGKTEQFEEGGFFAIDDLQPKAVSELTVFNLINQSTSDLESLLRIEEEGSPKSLKNSGALNFKKSKQDSAYSGNNCRAFDDIFSLTKLQERVR